jgi:hypothetical protein
VGFRRETVTGTLMNPGDKTFAFLIVFVESVVLGNILDGTLGEGLGLFGEKSV